MLAPPAMTPHTPAPACPCQMPAVEALTKDAGVILEAIRDSSVVTVGEEGIRPNVKVERNTIILREIPAKTPEESLRKIFSWEGCPPVKNIHSDVGDTW
jgi:hypothetical protein